MGGAPPEEVLAPPRKSEAYVSWRAATDLRAPYRVAPEFLKGTKPDADFDTDDAPLIVFINAKSGGRVGPELADVLSRAVGRSQVFDLSHQRPDTVLAQIWHNFKQQEQLGNSRAALVRSRLRILACGGDGTIAWIMKVIKQLDLQPQPPVAIMPLGTGNDLSRSFRWGPEFEHGWIQGHASVYSTLKRVADAQATNLDCWKLRLLLPNSTYQPAKTYAMTEVPQHEVQQVAAGSPGCIGEGQVLMEGVFWNYFSVGADAQAAYNFHHLRDNHPHLASNRVANQFWYSAFSCTSGWFTGTVPSVSSFSSVEVLQPGSSSWSTLQVPDSIKALVLVNLQSYGGGRNIWGTKPSKRKQWKQPSVSDGLIEVVGFHSGYHAMAVMGTGAKLANGKRLAQVAGIRLQLRDTVARPDNEPGAAFMQLDGEPWLQKVPAGAAAGSSCIMLEVVHWGTNKVLMNSSDPDAAPEKKMTKLLSQQQTEAYLTAAPAADKLEAPLPLSSKPQQQLQQVEDGVSDTAAGKALPQLQLDHPPAKPATHGALQPPARMANTDGGAPCSSSAAAAATAAAREARLQPRRSLEVQAVGQEEATIPASGAFPSPVSSDATDAPSAVAVIEARLPYPCNHCAGGVFEGPVKHVGVQQGKEDVVQQAAVKGPPARLQTLHSLQSA